MKPLSRDLLELRHIANQLARESAGVTDGKFIIDDYTMRRLVELLDKAVGKMSCRIKCQRCDQLSIKMDLQRDTLNQEIDDLKAEMNEFHKLPRFII